MPISLVMGVPDLAPTDDGFLDAERVARAFRTATVRAAACNEPQAAVDAALAALEEELCGAYVSCFVLEHDRMWLVAQRGYAMISDGLPVNSGVLGRAVRLGRLELVVDVAHDPDFVSTVRGTVSKLAVPLVAGGEVVGALNVETLVRLPDGCEDAVAPLVELLTPAVEALRSARTLDISALARLFVHLSSLRDQGELARSVVTSLTRVLPVECAQLFTRGDDGRLVEAAAWSTHGPRSRLSPSAAQALLERTDRTAVVELLTTAGMRMPELVGSDVRSVVVLPLRANGGDLGVLVGASSVVMEFDRGRAELAALLNAHAASSLEATLVIRRERRSALTDPLTGLLNRRGLEQRLDEALADAHTSRTPLSLVVMDCDDFKQVNDRAGHAFGDALLREVGMVLSRVVPIDASAARFGGDEFVAMLPALDADGAQAEVERLLEQVRSELDDAGFPVGMSAGVATYPFDGAAASQLVRAADQALYDAKEHGKGRVVTFRDAVGRHRAPREPEPADRRRIEPARLTEASQAAQALWDETTADRVLDRLAKTLTFVVGATGTVVSRLAGERLVDVVTHSLRDVDLGPDAAALIVDFPVTRHVVRSLRSRAISFLDRDLDPAEAFMLRELGMNACLLVPLVTNGTAWGLVEVYDMRMRRFSDNDQALADLLVMQAGRRLESLHGGTAPDPSPPLWRPPAAQIEQPS